MNPQARARDELPPRIIQGGMGVAVSGWRLARAVSTCGQLGVVSGTAIDVVMSRTLQLGDPGGHFRRALAAFPLREAADRILRKHFIEGGKPAGSPFRAIPMAGHKPSRETEELVIAANFSIVHLAKEGHDGWVGLNLLEKIQPPTLAALFGAMLAGVDVVLMGAGIPRQIPGMLDRFAAGECAEHRLDVTGATQPVTMRLDPAEHGITTPLPRPMFLPIVSSHVLALTLARKSSGRVDGFVVEGPVAGGHNAPPRGTMQLTGDGEPIYGERDQIDPGAFVKLGLPFWLAGGRAHPDSLSEAMACGARGIQVGSTFALCRESGFDPAMRARIIELIRADALDIRTSASASPTGFPFKVAQVPGTVADPPVYQARRRICDMGVLREIYQRTDGSVGYRCASEPVADYVAKGGSADDCADRLCLCNALCASAGVPQTRDGAPEPCLVTLGDDLDEIRHLLAGRDDYGADDVIRHLVG